MANDINNMGNAAFYRMCTFLDNSSLNNLLSTCKKFNEKRTNALIKEIFVKNVDPELINYTMASKECSINEARQEAFDRVREEVRKRIDIAAAIQYRGENVVIQQKVTWLKEWITNFSTGPTITELTNFLKSVTGSSTLEEGDSIIVNEAGGGGLYTHTCSRKIDLSPQAQTKEVFIAPAKELVLDY